MRKYWLGISIVAVWVSTAFAAILNRWGAVFHLTELWMVLSAVWTLRCLWRIVNRITRPVLQERGK